MKHTFTTKALSLLLTLVMLLGMLPVAALAAEDGPSDAAISALTELYSGDENRARSDLEAMYASGLIDESGSMVALDIREDGASVELAALTQRIAAGEDVGAITVNGNAATPEQIMQISQVSAALEIAQLLDEEIDVTDEHVANLESLLTGLADGSVDLDSALRSGELSLSKGNGTATLMGDGDNSLTLSDDGKSYIANYISGSTYEPSHAFALLDPNVTTWYADSDSVVAADGEGVITITFTESSQDLYMDEFSKVHIGSAEGERTDGTITVTATLDQALNVPVSVDCVLSGGTFRTDVSNPASPGLTTQTFTWAAGESGAKSITSKIDTDRLTSYAGYRWEGSLGYVFSIVNPRNAKLVDSSAPSKSLDSWNCTVYYKPYDEAPYVDEGKTTSTTINRIYVPGGTYYSGQVVPIYVYFNDPVCVGSATTITVNGTVCKSVCKTDYACRTVTFGYTVQDIDTSSLEITSLDGFRTQKNDAGAVMTISNLSSFTNTRIGAADGVYLSTKVKTRTLDTANAKWGVDDGDQVATVVIPLKGTGDEKQWLTEAATMSKSIQMDLPGITGTQNVDKYLTSGYFSTDGGKTRYPAYVVGEGSAIVARYTVPANTAEQVRRDGVGFYLDPVVLTADDAEKYIGAFDDWTEDVNGYYYFTAASNAQTAPLVSGCAFNYYVKGVVPFDDTQFVTRTQEYEDAGNGFIKLKDGSGYVLLRDKDHPENQYDVEVVVSETIYNAISSGTVRAEEAEDMDISYQISSRRSAFTFDDPKWFTWSSSNTDVLTIDATNGSDKAMAVLTGASSSKAVSITLTVGNGAPAIAYTITVGSFSVLQGLDAFLNIPSTSRYRTTLTGTDTDIYFSSNIAERNLAGGHSSTNFSLYMYKVDKVGDLIPEDATAVWNGSVTAAGHITIPGGQLTEPGNYAVSVSATYMGGENGSEAVNIPYTATAYVTVKQGPAKISLKKLDSYYVVKNNIPAITYELTSAVAGAEVKYTIQESGSEAKTESTGSASGGTITLSTGDFDGLKKAYTITVYARNKEADPWSVDSMLLTVYNDAALKLILSDVALGEIGGSTGGKAGDGSIELGTSYEMDNSSKITEHLATSGDGKGYQVDYDLDTLRTDAALQRVISANYGSGAWGIISDRMQWSSTEKSGDSVVESDDVTLNYKEEGGFYSDIRNYNYTYYMPTTDFLVVGTDNDTVTITATHGTTGLSASVEVEVHTLQDKLYMFRFLPKAETTVVYTNGKNEKRSLKTNANGELVVYEPDGIASDVVTMSTAGGETYVGTILNRNLVSGEKNIVNLQLYPCNNLSLVPISSQTLTFLTPDGKPYSGTVILRGGVYVNDEYVSSAGIRSSTSADLSVREDVRINVTNGKATVYFDPTQFISTDGWADNIRYVFEYRFDSTYLPGYIILDPASNDPAESIVNLRAIRGSDKVPAVIRQDYQQYYDGTTPTAYTRSVMDSTENIGISTRFSKAVLSTDYALLGESVGEGNKIDANRGYSTYQGGNVLTGALYTAEGRKLTGQTEVSADNLSATQILKLSDLNDETTLFVFPFSSVPMLRSTYTMTDANLKADSITDEGTNPTPTARVKAVFTRGDLTVKSINMPFGISNLSHQKDLSKDGNGAKEIGVEVKNNLKETTDIGAIFRSINVNDMIRKGFVFLGSLSGAGSDGPVNMMILPTQDPATFRIIAFVGANQRSSDDDDGVSVNFNAQDLAEDMNKFQKEMEEMGKDDDNESESNGEGSMEFNFYGTIILEAHIGVVDGDWDIAFRGGNVGTNVKGKYEWGQTFFCGPYPAFISFEVGFHADLEVAFGSKSAVRAMLLDAALGVSVEAFAGLGFDLSIVAIQLGIYGQIGADVNFLLLTPSNEGVKTGTKLTISGEIGIKLKVKLLFISYTQKFASTGFNWTKKWNNYDQIKQYWNSQGFGQLFGTTESGRAYTMYLFEDGSTMVAIEENGELESRDYLELAERAWLGGGSSAMRLMSANNDMTTVQENAYPYSHPAFTDDGALFLYVSDNNNAKQTEGVTSYAVKSGNGYADKGRVDTSESNILADLDVVASGTSSNAFAAWVKQVETPKMEKNAAVTNDDLGMMFNATEIYAGAYNGTAWTTTRLTDNYVADMAPTVASSGDRAIVAWRSLNASSMTAGADITAAFNVENNINFSIYNGSAWTTAQVAYNGNAGTVNAIDSAMLSDGTAILTYTVRTGDDVTSTETFYTVIKADGSVLTTGRLTNDSYTDANAQVTAVNDSSGGYFVLGWYSEHDAGEGTTPEYDANGNKTGSKAVVAHDIRLARINANGSYDIDFPESIGGSASAGVSSDFRFSAPAGNTGLENLSVVWSQRKDSDAAADEGKYQLNAVRFFKAAGVTGLTVPTLIAETDKNYTIDRFDAYTDASGAIHAIILGADYNNMVGGTVYDTIDLNAAANNTVSSNNADPDESTLTILDAEAISSLKLATGTFPATASDVTADINISEVIPGFTTPVQFSVTNTGTSVIDSVTATIGTQSKTFSDLNLLPNQSATLLMSYSVPEGAVSDANYSVTSSDATLGNGTLALNRPDVGISGIKLLQEHDGVRDIQVMLSNSSEIPLAGSGKTVKLAFYKDPFHENMIGSEVSIPGDALADIDAGTYTTVQTIDVTDIAALVDGEIPEAGLTVYAHAWVEDTEEPNPYNNDNYVSFTGLLARNNGEKLTTDTSVEVNTNEQSEVTGYTVYADIRNNSMQDTNVGTPVALLLDAEGNVIAQKNFQDASLTLTKEKSSSLSVAFTAEELNEKTPAEAIVGSAYTVTFDLNGGSSTDTIGPVTTDLEGHITIPEAKPTAPTGDQQLFFAGWYTQATDGEQITAETVFTEDATVYAHYVNHQHAFTYTVDGATITATCANADGFCYLPEESGIHKATLTIAAPEGEITYTGSAQAAIITDANAIQGDAKVMYAAKGADGNYGEASETAPVDAGTYKASITLGEDANAVTAYVSYTVAKADPTATAPSATATYGQTLADVTLTNPAGNTEGAWEWADDETTSVGTVGEHTFKAKFTPTDTANYNIVGNVDVAVTVSKAANPASVTSTATQRKGGNTIDLAANVTLNGATGAVSYAISGADNGCTLSGSVLTTGANSGSVTVNVTVAADENYEALVTPITVTIIDKYVQTVSAEDVTAAYGDTGVNITANVTTPETGGGALSYAVKSGDAVSVDASGNLTILKAGSAVVTVTAAETDDYAQATKDVTVTVSRKALTITADSDSKAYDGTPLTKNSYTNTELVSGDSIESVTVTGSQTYVGGSSNVPSAAVIKHGDTDVTESYDISYVSGMLTVTSRGTDDAPKYEITVTANSGEFLYDGTEKSVSGFETLEFTFNGVTYTVSGLTAIVTGIDAGTYTVAITGEAVVKDAAGEALNEQFIVNKVNGSLTINKRNVTLTSATKEQQYNGTALTDNTVTVTGDGWASGEGATFNVTGSQKVVGSSANSFTYTLNANTKADNYIITTAPGTLTVTSRDAKYEISPQANSDEVKYDGQEHTVSGFVTDTFTVDGNTYTVSGLTATVTGKDAGSYTVSVSGTAVVKDSDGSDVSSEFSVTPLTGTLTITKREVTLTSATASKEYDGYAISNDTVMVTVDGWAEGEGATYTVTGTRTLVGTSDNTFTYTLNANTKADNYTITTNYGTLTVNDRNTKYSVTLTADSGEFLYDGTEKTVNGWKIAGTAGGSFTAANGLTYWVSGMEATLTKTDAGSYDVTVTGTPVVKDNAGNDVTAQFQVNVEKGTLTINKRSVTLTSATDSKAYDGTALTNDTVTVSGDGFAEGEGATYTVTGSQTLPGDSANAYTYTLSSGTKAENYDITKVEGTLTISNRTDDGADKKYEITVKANSDTVTYDGQEHTVSGFETLEYTFNGVTYIVSGLTATTTETNAGTYPVTVTGTAVVKDAAGNDLTAQFTVNTVNGNLTINKTEISGAIVSMDAFAYGEAASAPAIVSDGKTGSNGAMVGSDPTKQVTYYYQATAFLKSQTENISTLGSTEGVYTAITPTTFAVGNHYVLAVVTGGNYSNVPYITQSVFEVKQNTDTVRTAPTAPTVEDATVTVAAADRSKTLEYSLDGQTWLPVTLDENGQFTAEWPNAVENATLLLREAADENYAQPSASAQGSQTVTTTTFTVTYDANGGINAPDAVTVTKDKTVTISNQRSMTRKGYTFDGWNTAADGSGTPYAAGNTVNTGLTLYAQWKVNTYTVYYNANGGTGTMEKQSFTYDVAQALTEHAFTRTDYIFLGWSKSSSGGVQYQDKQSVKNVAESGTVTLYAVWAKDLYNVNGTVKSAEAGQIDIELVQGNNSVVSTEVTYDTPNEEVPFTLNGVPAGTYNLIAKQGDKTMTVAVIITDDHVALETITMPEGDTSSVLSVSGSETPAIVVSGLDQLASDEEIEERSVTVTMTVEAQAAGEAAEAAEEIQEVADRGSSFVYLDITVKKEIYNDGDLESTETITETGNTLEFIIPFDFTGKSTVKVYRYHDGVAEALTEDDTGAEGTYRLDRTNGLIYVYAEKFSTYAIGYTTMSYYEPTTYTPTITETEHGTVSVDPRSAASGTKVTITVKPDEGYELDTLKVTDAYGREITLTENEDGTYTYTQPGSKVTITATFKEKEKPAQTFFVDVPEGSYYYDAVKWAVENGITYGVDETHFAPNASCTRAQMVTFIWRAAGEPEPTASTTAFTDVDESAYYYKAVLWAYENGITVGTSATTFSPNDTVTRCQSVTFLFRALSGAAGTENPFLDVKDGAYYFDAVKWAYENGITVGTSETTFSPENDCLRAQIVTFLYRAYN